MLRSFTRYGYGWFIWLAFCAFVAWRFGGSLIGSSVVFLILVVPTVLWIRRRLPGIEP